MCDSFKSKTTSKSSVTKLPAVTPIAQKQSKAKRKKDKKAKSLPIRSELTTEAVTKANSSCVDDGKLQANIVCGKSVTSTNTLTCEAKQDATLVALMDQKENPDEDLSWRNDVLPPCMVDYSITIQEKTVAEGKKNEPVCTSVIPWFEETSSIPDVCFESVQKSVTEDGSVDPSTLSFIEPPAILKGLSISHF